VLKAENNDDMGEGCVTVTWIQFNLQLLQITGDVKYAEELERSVYNHLLAAENPQTGCVSYYTALDGPKPYRCDQGYSCCLSSVPRGISLIPEMMGGKINGTYTLLFYENGQATENITAKDGTQVTLKVKTATKFPLDSSVMITVDPSKTTVFTLSFRIPAWSRDFKAKIGGNTFGADKRALLSISRTWKPGDKVEISFKMPVQVISGGLSYPDAVAIKRGPQIFAVDLGLNKSISALGDVSFSNTGSLTDEKSLLPADWRWKEAYSMQMNINNKPQKVIIVPFSEAGQDTSPIGVWIKH
ncbi:MAG TPA: beta-L-arabinofuranosidase domain-containing protein, partial [Mucilaginibacter sp.]|nr:beta-L-arabinofuranosidase domain-containing protein [Mucilaginibacter sp.]